MASLSSISNADIYSIANNNHEPSWLSQMRQTAFSKYMTLPDEVSPLYTKYSDVNYLNPGNIYLDEMGHTYEAYDELKDRLKQSDLGTCVLTVGSSINSVKLSEIHQKSGIVIMDIRNALTKYEDLIRDKLMSTQINFGEDKFLALEASAFKSGLLIYIPRNVTIDEPIRVINSLTEDGISSVSRHLVIAESGSRATVVQEIYSPPEQAKDDLQQAYFELLECHVGQNASLEMVTLQAMGKKSVDFSNRKAFIERDGKISWYVGMFGAQHSRYKVDSIMNGPGSSAEDVEIIFGVANQSFDITSNLVHNGNNSRGRVLVKSVMKDASKSLFKGMIKIAKEAKASESYLAGHAILLDKAAKSDTIPGLEIETNEVKATHSASVAQLDESQIFYLMSRGLSREYAKREIVNGFLEPLSRKMGPTIRAWINYLIENKWSGKSLMLRTDEAMEQILEVEKSRYRETQDIFEKHYKYR